MAARTIVLLPRLGAAASLKLVCGMNAATEPMLTSAALMPAASLKRVALGADPAVVVDTSTALEAAASLK
jgi:hypothetical protein